MTPVQQVVTIALCVAGTLSMRALPFLAFGGGRRPPAYVRYLGRALPLAVFAMLIAYCLKDVDFLADAHGIPELVAIAATAGLHLWKRNMALSIAGGTLSYLALLQIAALM